MRKSKEQLLIEALTIENEVFNLYGESVDEIDINSYSFKREVCRNTINTLEGRVEVAKSSLEEAKKKKAEEEFQASENGKELKKLIDQLEDEFYVKIDEKEAASISALNIILADSLGKEWGVTSFDGKRIEIGVIDHNKPLKSSGEYNPIFGLEFDIRLGKDFEGEEVFEINYGCLGSFNPSDTPRVIFLQGLAKFSSDAELQNKVKHYADEYQLYKTSIWKEVKAKKAELDYIYRNK